jgi:TonB family protein
VESVEVIQVPYPGLDFDTGIRDCVSQWRFEPDPAAEGSRVFRGKIRFQINPALEQAVRQALEQLAASWNNSDPASVATLEVTKEDLAGWKGPAFQTGSFLRKAIEGEAPGAPFSIELDPDVTFFRFMGPDLVRARQAFHRKPKGETGAGVAATLDLTAVKGLRGWRFGQMDPAAARAVQPVRVGPNSHIKQPRKVKDVRPDYPLIAKDARVQGTVILECVLSTEGKVTEVKILRGIPMLDKSAVEAVRQWVYEPTFLNGVAVPVIMLVTVDFRLR